MRFWVILLTNRQTDKRTRANAFTSSFVGGNNIMLKSMFRLPIDVCSTQLLVSSLTNEYLGIVRYGSTVTGPHSYTTSVSVWLSENKHVLGLSSFRVKLNYNQRVPKHYSDSRCTKHSANTVQELVLSGAAKLAPRFMKVLPPGESDAWSQRHYPPILKFHDCFPVMLLTKKQTYGYKQSCNVTNIVINTNDQRQYLGLWLERGNELFRVQRQV